MVILSLNMVKKTKNPLVGRWEGNTMYPISVFVAPGKTIDGSIPSEEDLEERIQVCESRRLACALRERCRDSRVVLGLSWFGSSEGIFFGRPDKVSGDTTLVPSEVDLVLMQQLKIFSNFLCCSNLY